MYGNGDVVVEPTNQQDTKKLSFLTCSISRTFIEYSERFEVKNTLVRLTSKCILYLVKSKFLVYST